jgi:SnoaL-like protein
VSPDPTAFQRAIDARDHDALRRSLAPDVVLHSPIRFRPFAGRNEVAAILRIPAEVFVFHDSFRYTSILGQGSERALFFEGRIDGRTIEGVDHLRLDEDGLVTELRVMMRPLAPVQRFAETAAEILSRTT